MLMMLLAAVLYIAPIVGDGSNANPYRTALGSYTVEDGISCIPSLSNGQPRFSWTFNIVKRSASVDNSILALPVRDLDASITMTVTQWNNLKAALNTRGVNTTGLTKDSTLREVAQAIVTLLASCPDFLKWVPRP